MNHSKFKDVTLGFIAFILIAGSALAGVPFTQTQAQEATQPACDPSYADVCIPSKPPDLDCIQISERNIQVVGNDPHDLDRDSDGIGCEAPVRVQPTPEPEPEVPPVIPAENETQVPEIPIEVNQTIPIPVPPNTTTGNETEPVQLPINDTEAGGQGNETIEVPELPVEPSQPPTGETGNQTEQLPEEIPAENSTDTVPIEIPINSSTGNETIPVPPIEVTPPESNATQNATVEPEPEPLPPGQGGGGGETGNETATGGNETAPENCLVPPCPPSGPQGNETIPVEGNVTLPTEGNVTVPIEGNVTTSEPEPEPGGGNETSQNQTQTGPGGTETEPPFEEPAQPQQNATQIFDNVVNNTAILEDRIDQTGENGEANETQRADIKEAIGESLGAMGDASNLIVNATNDQLISIADISGTVSEAIDIVVQQDDNNE